MSMRAPREVMPTVAKEQPKTPSDSTVCRYLTDSRERSAMASRRPCTSSVSAVKPSKRLRVASAITALLGHPTTVSTPSSVGGVEMPKSLRRLRPS